MQRTSGRTTTRVAIRVMGVWVRRADALVQDGALANAARAVDELRAGPTRMAGTDQRRLSAAAAPCP